MGLTREKKYQDSLGLWSLSLLKEIAKCRIKCKTYSTYEWYLLDPLNYRTLTRFAVSKTTRELLLKWNTHKKAVELSPDLKLPQFTVERVETGHCEEGSLIGE